MSLCDWKGILLSQWFHSCLAMCGDSMAIYLTRYSMAFRAVFMQQSALAVWLFGCPVAFRFSSIINTLSAPINRLWECGLVSAPEISLSAVLLVDFGKLLKSCGAVYHATHCEGFPFFLPNSFLSISTVFTNEDG